MDAPFLVAGLGNPGAEYAQTRHNIGFMVADCLARRWGCAWEESRRLRARLARAVFAGQRGWLCQPLTFMNLSGEAVGAALEYYQVPLTRLLVIVDDADLPLGVLRLRPEGSSGGHHGLESIQTRVGSTAFARLRVGIGRQAGQPRELASHVLSRFGAGEISVAEQAVERAASQVECWLTAGVQAAMNQFNGPLERPTSQESAE
ncbi:MAG: aminoacyl-tRNA hydrolase [Verrucomicrobiae bacterium]|nr:aminoacyl-tRNA hydrolase [Verrucomicrobiae bacterium]